MTPEAKARQQIDLSPGVIVVASECPTDTWSADYVLFVNQDAVGVIEAKKHTAGEVLTVAENQAERYAAANLKWRKDNTSLRFLFEATGQIVRFTDNADPAPRSREVFQFSSLKICTATCDLPRSSPPTRKSPRCGDT